MVLTLSYVYELLFYRIRNRIMDTINNIFSKGKLLQESGVIPKIRYNREHLLKKETAERLNTYLNFGIFPTFTDTADPGDKQNPEQKIGTPGARSIFNRAGAVILGSENGGYAVDITNGDEANTHWWRIANNVPLMDSPKARQRIRKSSGCSIKELVDASSEGLMGQETYDYSDFMYCKHLGKVSNNYMITLRRFPLPVDDYIGASGEDAASKDGRASNNASCIGCMVTWLGTSGNTMENILKYNFKMPFKEEEAEWQDAGASADENATVLNGMFAAFDKQYQKEYQDGYADAAANKFFSHLGVDLGNAPYKGLAGFRDTKTKVYGPVDSIRSTYVRDDKGLAFEQSFSLVFEYELKSYNGINGKQAMLDLISNILNVTYSTGSFWGGGYRGYAAHQSNIFANLNIFKARGGFTNFVDAFASDLTNLTGGIRNTFAGKKPWEVIKGLLNSIGGMLMSGMLNKMGRPQKAMYNALLSPAPIGFWHVTIGNPKKPIMSIGNMIITNCEIEHQGPLGLDDFPTGLKVTVQLTRGKPRDLRDIEKLYMQGNDRIYTSMGDKIFDMYKNAELYQAHRKAGTIKQYKPVSDVATVNIPADTKAKPSVTINGLKTVNDHMKKYFGTNDAYSIYVPAAEQEYGAGTKKPSTRENKSLVGDNKK